MQETGETSLAIKEDADKRIQEIVNANKHRREPYWIVLYATPSKVNVEGKPTLMQVIKPYFKRPQAQVGMIIGEVNNETGEITWEINMPQKPFDWGALTDLGGKPCHEVVTETTTMPGAYVTK